MVNEAEVKVKSLQKALEILNCFTKKSSWGVTEMTKAAGTSWDSACIPCVIRWDRT